MAVRVQDTFTGTSGTDLQAHTPDVDVGGGGWTDSTANGLELDGSGQLKANSSTNDSRIDGGVADCKTSYDFNAGGADNRAIICIRRDNTPYPLEDGYIANIRPATSSVYIYRVDNGSLTQLGASIAVTMNTSTTYNMELEANGSTLTLRIDSSDKGTRTDSTYLTNTFGGIRHALYTSAGARFDNFLIETLVTEVALGLASETATALAITSSKTSALGLATETDTAFATGASKTRSIGLALEADTAFALGINKTSALGLASETDTAFAVNANKTVVIGIASESDLALALVTAIFPGKLCGTVSFQPVLSGSITYAPVLDGNITYEPSLRGDVALRRCN